ncbi:MAG: type pilus assembly protein PilM [Fimbriimonadaceae bacterium]|jgi:type IV pilus assembly protein PilM|nr:type pilus assembly protein PilM [Fimbriimonadaceae bacterium]
MLKLKKYLRRDSLSLGIDIGSHAVKVMLAESVGDRMEVRGASSFAMPVGMVANGVITNPKKFAKSLATEIGAFGQRPAGAVMSIPSTMAVLRWVSLPQLAGEELRQAARYKVKRHLPFPVGDAYVDASPPEVMEDGSMGQSLVIAVRKEVIDSRAEALELAGVGPVGAELEAQAILRVVERQLNEKSVLWRDASLTIIDVGGSNTHMYVVQNQRLQFIRGVKFGSDQIAEAVSKAMDVSHEAAHVLISAAGTELRPDGVLVLKVDGQACIVNVQQEMDKLVREFLRLLRYFRSLHPERSYAGILDNVVVCGGMVGLNGFTGYLQQALGIRVERARPFTGMVAQLRRETFQSVTNHQEAYTVVMGLALAGLGGELARSGENNARSEFNWTRAA